MVMNHGPSGAGLDSASERVIEKIRRRSNLAVAVVVNTGDANSYGVIVNLGRAGVPIISIDSEQRNITFFSRYAAKILAPDYRESEDTFIDFLLAIGARLHPKPVLFVNGDEQLMMMAKNRKRLEHLFFFPFAPYDLAEKLVNKASFYRMLTEYSIPHAQTYLPDTVGDVEEIGDRLDYPYILKPVQSQSFSQTFGNKCIRVSSAGELIYQYGRITAVEGPVVVQKEIAGTERYLVYTYFSRDSIPLGVCCYRKVRIFPTDFGNASVCKTVIEQDVIDLCTELLRKIGYRGLSEAEIQRDTNDGQLKLVEINARTTTQSLLSARCGVNMEYIAYRDALGFEQQCLINEKVGILWVDLLRDCLSVLSFDGYLVQKRITVRKWFSSLRGARVFAYFTWDDPVPSVVIFFRLLAGYVFKRERLATIRAAFVSLGRRK